MSEWNETQQLFIYFVFFIQFHDQVMLFEILHIGPITQFFFKWLSLLFKQHAIKKRRRSSFCDYLLLTPFLVILVTVCPCNVRGNCKIAAKQLQGMPTIQSAVGTLLGTFAVIGKQKGKEGKTK